MEATCCSEISDNFQRTTCRYVPENVTLDIQGSHNLKAINIRSSLRKGQFFTRCLGVKMCSGSWRYSSFCSWHAYCDLMRTAFCWWHILKYMWPFCLTNELWKCCESCIKLLIEGHVPMHIPVTSVEQAVLCAVRNLLIANVPIGPTSRDLCDLTLYRRQGWHL
jgi:hypothetical protein